MAQGMIFPISMAEAEGSRTIYYLIPTLVDEFQTESQRMIESVFSTLNYKVVSVNADGNPELQARQLRNAADDNPAGIIVNAVDALSIGEALKSAQAKGIPILVYDRMLSTDEAFDFASVSNAEAIGQMAANKAIDLLVDIPGSSAQKTILQIVGDPGDTYSLRVLAGFQATLRKHKRINVITVPAMGWEPANARMLAKEHLKLNPDLIFCHSSDLAAAVIPLIEPDIRSHKVAVMAITGAPVGINLLAQGLESFEIEQPLYAQVYGLALGLQGVMDRKKGMPGLKDGPCEILGVSGKLEANGRVLTLKGRPLVREDLKDDKNRAMLGLWGDLARPTMSADKINSLACEGH
jgi:ribose transport system substrate-binding protein